MWIYNKEFHKYGLDFHSPIINARNNLDIFLSLLLKFVD